MSLMTLHKTFVATSIVFSLGFRLPQIFQYMESIAAGAFLLCVGPIVASGSLFLHFQPLIRKRVNHSQSSEPH